MPALDGNPVLDGLNLACDGRNFTLRSEDLINGTRRLVLGIYE